MLLNSPSTTLAPETFAVGPTALAEGPATLRVPGATLLVVPEADQRSANAALKSLRGFRTDGRAVVWANLGELAEAPHVDLGQWGRRLVEEAGAQLVVMCGPGGRDVAVGARRAGLPLGRVPLARTNAAPPNVPGDSGTAGDAILALGIPRDSAQRLADRLESRFSRTLTAA